MRKQKRTKNISRFFIHKEEQLEGGSILILYYLFTPFAFICGYTPTLNSPIKTKQDHHINDEAAQNFSRNRYASYTFEDAAPSVPNEISTSFIMGAMVFKNVETDEPPVHIQTTPTIPPTSNCNQGETDVLNTAIYSPCLPSPGPNQNLV